MAYSSCCFRLEFNNYKIAIVGGSKFSGRKNNFQNMLEFSKDPRQGNIRVPCKRLSSKDCDIFSRRRVCAISLRVVIEPQPIYRPIKTDKVHQRSTVVQIKIVVTILFYRITSVVPTQWITVKKDSITALRSPQHIFVLDFRLCLIVRRYCFSKIFLDLWSIQLRLELHAFNLKYSTFRRFRRLMSSSTLEPPAFRFSKSMYLSQILSSSGKRAIPSS